MVSNKTKFDETKTQISNRPRILCELIFTSCMEYTRCTNLLWSAILIYLACRERGNEGIIHRPKVESEFLAKKKTFEANIFKFFLKGEPISKFRGAANQNTYRKFVKYDLRCLRLLEIFHMLNPPYPLEVSTF